MEKSGNCPKKTPAGKTGKTERTAKNMTEFIFEGRGKAQRTGHERIAMYNIRHAINWIVGGYYNDILDGNEEYLPESRKALEDEIYSSAMTNRYDVGMESCGRAPKEMRFAGEAFCRAYIHFMLDEDSDIEEISEAAGW